MRTQLSLLTIFSCFCFGVSDAEAKKNQKCPEAGTEVLLAKVMDPAFASDYQDCDIVVKADFLANGMVGAFAMVDTKGLVFFQALAEGATAQTNALSGQAMGYVVGIDKATSDVVYTLKPGDKLVLRGGTRVGHSPLLASYTEVVFVATQVQKAQ